jgi:hypothetical protein
MNSQDPCGHGKQQRRTVAEQLKPERDTDDPEQYRCADSTRDNNGAQWAVPRTEFYLHAAIDSFGSMKGLDLRRLCATAMVPVSTARTAQ